MKVDFHTHFIPQQFPDMGEKYGGEGWPTLLQASFRVPTPVINPPVVFTGMIDVSLAWPRMKERWPSLTAVLFPHIGKLLRDKVGMKINFHLFAPRSR